MKAIMRKIYHFDEVDSTQSVMKGLAEEKVPDRSVVFADVQTDGKGRFGRKWVSPAGGLWFSMVLYPQMEPEEAVKLTIIAGIAAVETVKELAGIELKLKWPNDIVHEDAGGGIHKAGGILTETVLGRKKIKYAVIGMGINVNNDMGKEKTGAVSLKKLCGRKIRIKELLKEIITKFDNYYQVLASGGFEPVVEIYRKLSLLTGRKVTVDSGGRTLSGTVKAIDADGSLILATAEGEKKLFAGEVSIVKY